MKKSKQTIGKHAVVIGGSMAGKLAARVLSEFFSEVTVLERDSHPADRQLRKGVLQEHHNHLLLKGGELVLEVLFPGLVRELQEMGAQRIDTSRDLKWLHHGLWKIRYPSGVSLLFQSRPLLESLIGKRLEAIENIRFHYNTNVGSFLKDDKSLRIIGVQLNGGPSTLSADFVVDASGPASITAQWFHATKQPFPSDRVKINLGYASRMYEWPSQSPDWSGLAIYGKPPHDTRGGVILKIEGNRFIVSLYGYAGDYPPNNEEDFVEYARSLAQPDVYDMIKQAKPLSEMKTFRIPMMVRHYFEKVKSFPDGLITMGDSYCRFDPVFGQGISVAALEALALREALSDIVDGKDKWRGFPTKFQKKIAKIVDIPWSVVKGEVFRYPQTEGVKPPGLAFTHWYNKKIFELSASDEQVFGAFIRVMNFVSHPLALFHPSIVYQVIRESIRQRQR